MQGPGPRGRTEAEVTIGRDLDAVPRARRLVRSFLAGTAKDIVADAELVVTELVTNAVLHGAPPVLVRLAASSDSVRVEVEDRGPGRPLYQGSPNGSMTGRGLAVVQAVCCQWGVLPGVGSGKVVWAEIAGPAGAIPPYPETGDLSPPPATEPLFTARLPSVPTELLLQAKAQMDDVVRELLLLGRGNGQATTLDPALAALVKVVTVDVAEVRAQMKQAALKAKATGRRQVDLELQLPLSAADSSEKYLAALEEADRRASSATLLSLASTRSHQLFRKWYLQSVAEQIRAAARGEEPPEPPPLSLVLAAETDRLAGG